MGTQVARPSRDRQRPIHDEDADGAKAVVLGQVVPEGQCDLDRARSDPHQAGANGLHEGQARAARPHAGFEVEMLGFEGRRELSALVSRWFTPVRTDADRTDWRQSADVHACGEVGTSPLSAPFAQCITTSNAPSPVFPGSQCLLPC